MSQFTYKLKHFPLHLGWVCCNKGIVMLKWVPLLASKCEINSKEIEITLTFASKTNLKLLTRSYNSQWSMLDEMHSMVTFQWRKRMIDHYHWIPAGGSHDEKFNTQLYILGQNVEPLFLYLSITNNVLYCISWIKPSVNGNIYLNKRKKLFRCSFTCRVCRGRKWVIHIQFK